MPHPLLRNTSAGNWLGRLPLVSEKSWMGYLAAIVLSLLATVVRHALDPILPPGFPFLTYFPALVVTAFVFGWRAGISAAILSFFLSWYFFIPPARSFSVQPGSLYALALYLFVVTVDLLLIWLAQAAYQALAKEREKSELLAKNRELLFHELQHRVGNNLQMVGAMLALQKEGLSDDAAAALDQAARRVRAIGATQRDLYRTEGGSVLLNELVEKVSRDALRTVGRDEIDLTFAHERALAIDPDEAIPAAVILSESIGNALEHGLPDRRGAIHIATTVGEGRVTVMVRDDGGTLPESFQVEQANSLGLRLACALAEQMRGSYDLRRDGVHTVAQLTFPLAS